MKKGRQKRFISLTKNALANNPGNIPLTSYATCLSTTPFSGAIRRYSLCLHSLITPLSRDDPQIAGKLHLDPS